jgi:hypothetical protein
MTTYKQALKFFTVAAGLALAGSSAYAQSASVGNTVGVDLGSIKGVHADQTTVGIKDGNIYGTVGVADGVKIDNNKVISGTNVGASVPLTEIIVPGSSVVEQVIGIRF